MSSEVIAIAGIPLVSDQRVNLGPKQYVDYDDYYKIWPSDEVV